MFWKNCGICTITSTSRNENVDCWFMQTGSYTNKEGQKVYTHECIVNEHYFCESKSEGNFTPSQNPVQQSYTQNAMVDSEGFMQIPTDMEELPFN